MTSPDEWKILEWDEKTQTNEQTNKQTNIHSLQYEGCGKVHGQCPFNICSFCQEKRI